jgi:hypothetical protein
MLEPLSKRVNDLGWHVQIHMLADQIAQTEDVLRRLPSSIVFDHLARIPTRLPDCRKKADAKPDDAVLFDALADWAPDEKTRNLILSYKNRVMLES